LANYTLFKYNKKVNTLEQLNISQLRNLWLRSPDERLASWRDFRIELQSHYDHNVVDGLDSDDNVLLSLLEAISCWWEQAPTVSVALDPFNSKSWPTVWEIIYDGECCKYSRGLAMAYNMHYMDSSIDINVSRVRDTLYNDEYILATFAGKYALNSLHGRIINLQNVDSFKVQESYDIRDILYSHQ
jgi:hypothetical protein